ncbi:MAG: hypothetical protein RLY43_4 [Bacteroidota bacterium]|jgi:ribosomal protein L37AE/L43A
MADLAYYNCYVCGADITTIVVSTGLYQCPHCGTRQSGTPINSTPTIIDVIDTTE